MLYDETMHGEDIRGGNGLTYNIGLQLYTLRNLAETDFTGMLQKVAEIGYQGVEFAGYGGLSAHALRDLLDGLGMKAASSHIALPLLESDESLEYAAQVGIPYVVCPWLDESSRTSMDDYRRVAERLVRIEERARNHGLTLCYHNHAFEFELMEGGRTAWDVLFEAAPPVKAELDVYWVQRAGMSAQATLRKFNGRCPLVHVKDMAADAERSFAELGTGTLDLPDIIKTAADIGADWYFVEQDVCKRDPLESITISYKYLQRIGIV